MSKIIKRGKRYVVTDSSVTKTISSHSTAKEALKKKRVVEIEEKKAKAQKKAKAAPKKKEKVLKRKK